MVSTEVSISGYQVKEELYNGSRTLVYRGYRENDSLAVVIKVLKNTYPSFSELVQFRNQYTIAKNLNYPGIIQTYSLETSHNGYALVMEDFGGISLKDYFNHVETLHITSYIQEFLQVAISLCDILEILYQQRVIHKDIKPANILINPETKQVKLIDFSIATLLNKETQEIKNISVLCLPIMNQGQLIGILYLENDSTSCVFTNKRIFVLDFLCTQATISLENARLYSQQQQKNREIA